jgi:competence ComEA-like helix-hairpin-helix protein
LPTPPGGRATKSLPNVNAPNGRINLPAGMILRCLPPEVLSADVDDFEKSGQAATDIGLPMNSILGQLPSGKVEMTMQELVPLFPPGFLQPTESISNYMSNVVSLPLMDIVMRIPPDLLALRPDQKDVDAAVINMADPFTEEILREQAEAARRQSGAANIIEESQAPQEEFVPSGQAPKTMPAPRRPTVEPLVQAHVAATTLAAPSVPVSVRAPFAPTASASSSLITTPPNVPESRPPTSRASGPLPERTTIPLPLSVRADTPAASSAPVPPVPRHTAPIPAPPPPRHTTGLPAVPRRTGSLKSLSQSMRAAAAAKPADSADSFVAAPPVPVVPQPPVGGAPADEPAVPKSSTETGVIPGVPDPGADDLQRLAALAMAQLGEDTNEESESLLVSKPTPPEPRSPMPPAPAAPAIVLSQPTPPNAEPVPVAPPVAVAPSAPAIPKPVAAPVEPILPPAAPPVPEALRSLTPSSARAVAAVQPPAEPARVPTEPIRAPSEPLAGAEEEEAAIPSFAFNVNTCSADDLVKNIPECPRSLADAIIAHRQKIGSFERIEDLLDVPGMTKTTYTDLTGEPPPEHRVQLSLNELLGFPEGQSLSLKDVTERISCWPDVTGCLLSQSIGLSLVGEAPAGVDKAAVVAFAPRMFEAVNKSFSELAGQETDALVIPAPGTSFHFLRSRDLYLIIMSRLPQMPDRHLKVARLVLAALNTRKE